MSFFNSFKISSLSWIDIDECKEETADCALNATCSDTDGGYTCTCRSGFEGDGKTCTGDKRIRYWLIVLNITLLPLSSLSILNVIIVLHSTMTQLML